MQVFEIRPLGSAWWRSDPDASEENSTSWVRETYKVSRTDWVPVPVISDGPAEDIGFMAGVPSLPVFADHLSVARQMFEPRGTFLPLAGDGDGYSVFRVDQEYWFARPDDLSEIGGHRVLRLGDEVPAVGLYRSNVGGLISVEERDDPDSFSAAIRRHGLGEQLRTKLIFDDQTEVTYWVGWLSMELIEESFAE